ncbi:phosphatidylinositol-binding protein scs2 [Sorochytrium milnesiophthora]
MALQLDPPEKLTFRRPFTAVVKTTLFLKNVKGHPVAYKVKTTAPKQYCVRPNSGTLGPDETAEVQILLQPMKEDPPADARCKDKFLVQSIGITAADASLPPQEIWTKVDGERKSEVEEHKLRVVWASVDGDSGDVGDLASPTSARRSMAAPEDTFHTLAPAVSPTVAESRAPTAKTALANNGAPAAAAAPAASTSGQTSATGQAPTPSGNAPSDRISPFASPNRPPSAIFQPVVNNVHEAPSEQDLKSAKAKILDLERRITGYEMQIRQLQSQTNELRKRKTAENEAAGGAGVVTKTVYTSTGYSVQIVIAAAVIAFMLGVLIF